MDPNWLQAEPESEPDEPSMYLDMSSMKAVSISVRGKRIYYTSLSKEQVEAGEDIDPLIMPDMEAIVMEHGRHAVMTFKLKDGTKRRYRGNGGVIRGPAGEELTDYAKGRLREMMLREIRLRARRELLEESKEKKG